MIKRLFAFLFLLLSAQTHANELVQNEPINLEKSLVQEIKNLSQSPRYSPDNNGIDSRIKDFNEDERKAALLYISAFKEAYSTLNLGIKGKAVAKQTPVWHSRAWHFFDDRIAESFSFNNWWRVYIQMWPLLSETNIELQKIKTMEELESLRAEILKSLVPTNREEINLKFQNIVKNFPGNSSAHRTRYLQDLVALKDKDLKELRSQVQFELKLNQVFNKEKFLSRLEILRFLRRVKNDLRVDINAPYFLWSKVVPVLSYNNLRHFADDFSAEHFKTILGPQFANQIAIRIYVSKNKDFISDVFESEMPLRFLSAWISSENLGLPQNVFSTIENLLKEQIHLTQSHSSSLAFHRLKRVQDLILLRKEKMQDSISRINEADLTQEIGNIDYRRFFTASFSVYMNDGTKITEDNFTNVQSLKNADMHFTVIKFSDDVFTMKLENDALKGVMYEKSNCDGLRVKMQHRMFEPQTTPKEYQSFSCHEGVGLLTRRFGNDIAPSGVIATATKEGKKYFEQLLGIQRKKAEHPAGTISCTITLAGGMTGTGYGFTEDDAKFAARKKIGYSKSNPEYVECGQVKEED